MSGWELLGGKDPAGFAGRYLSMRCDCSFKRCAPRECLSSVSALPIPRG